MRAESFIPGQVAPMEATTADHLPDGAGWQFEPKWDGFRCLAFKTAGSVDLRAKSGKPLGRFFPEMVTLLADLPADDFVLDGELVIETSTGLSFDALQMRVHPAESRIRKLSRETPARLIVFDALVIGGADLTGSPLRDRRAALETFMAAARVPERLELSPITADRKLAAHWLRGSGAGATDGVVAKKLDEPYRPGERTMVKVKRLRTADCVVGGFRYASAGKTVGSLLLGLYNDEGHLDHVGFTSGIAASERAVLTRRLEALREPPGFTGRAPGGPSRWSTERSAQWEPLRPELVVEVRYDHVTDGRFRHGTKLLRWRPDKAPAQCRTEQIV